MWRSLDFSISEGASMHEEHEREVAHEIEQETQIQRPPRAKALRREVDTWLREFVRVGSNLAFQKFTRAYDVVDQTSATDPAAAELFGHLRVTMDFIRTVDRPQSGYYDSYLRPANWILASKQSAKPTDLLLVSQYEVNQLFDEIYASSAKVKLLTYEPRVTKFLRAVDLAPPGLVSPSVVSWQSLALGLRRELHLFAGQAYFSTFEEYREFITNIIPANPAKPAVKAEQVFRFIKDWIAVRRKGQNFLPTHIGQMVSNRTIKEGAFD